MGEFCGWLQILKFQVGNMSKTIYMQHKKNNLFIHNIYLFNNKKYSVSESTTPGIQKYAII